MSLYNQLMGYDEFAPTVLRLLGVDPREIPRFRDATIIEVEGDYRMCILTRTGGANRPDYQDGIAMLRAVAGFIRDFDTPEDTTFAQFEYAPTTEPMRTLIVGLGRGRDDNRSPLVKYSELITRMTDPKYKDDPRVQRAIEVGKAMFAPILESLDKGENVRVIGIEKPEPPHGQN